MKKLYISTHTPLARRDNSKVSPEYLPKISTHTPLARRDVLTDAIKPFVAFLLTRLLRGVTDIIQKIVDAVIFLLTRLLRGVTRAKGHRPLGQ